MSATQIYPDCSFTARAVRSGGMTKRELLTELRNRGVSLNEAGRALFAHDGFTTSPASSVRETAEIMVKNLGLDQGGTMAELLDRASRLGLTPCPLELGPHLRLRYLDQPEGHAGFAPLQHRAPAGSLTIVSALLIADDDAPKGFYLRRINGTLWLRGYRSGPDHLWSPEDRLVFMVSPNPA